MEKILNPTFDAKKFEDKEKAKEWAQKEFRFWNENLLKKDEIKNLEKYTILNKDGRNLRLSTDLYLTKCFGDLKRMSNESYATFVRKINSQKPIMKEKKFELDKNIELLDGALKRSKITETIHILGEAPSLLLMQNGLEPTVLRNLLPTADTTEVNALKAKYMNKPFDNYNYIIGYLKDEKLVYVNLPKGYSNYEDEVMAKWQPVYEYKIPQKIHGGYFQQNHGSPHDFNPRFVIQRGLKCVIKDIKVINYQNSEFRQIKFEIDVLPT